MEPNYFGDRPVLEFSNLAMSLNEDQGYRRRNLPVRVAYTCNRVVLQCPFSVKEESHVGGL
jgi:hypothetical protein